MVYQKTNKIQRHQFTCLEELKCDIIEQILAWKESVSYYYASIIINSKDGRILYDKFLDADVNGFGITLDSDDELTPDKVFQSDSVILSLNEDGMLFVERNQIGINGVGEGENFVYLSAEQSDQWLSYLKDKDADVLVFSIK